MKRLVTILTLAIVLLLPVWAQALDVSTIVFYEKNKHLFGSSDAVRTQDAIDWENDTIKVTFLTTATSMDAAAHDFYDDVSAGATSTPQTLDSCTAAADAVTGAGKLDCADESAIVVAAEWRYIVVWRDGAGAAATDPLLFYLDAGSGQAAGTYNLKWHASGLVQVE